MPSLAEVTRKMLMEHPEIDYYLRVGWMNHRAIARNLKPEIEAELGGAVEVEAIATAIRRYAETIRKSRLVYPKAERKILAKSRVHLMSRVAIVTFKPNWELAKELRKISKEITERGGELILFVQSPINMTFGVDEHHLHEILEVAKKSDILQLRKGLSALVMVSPEEIAETPGVIAKVASKLGRESVNIVEMISSFTTTIFLVEKESAQKAYQITERLIEASQEVRQNRYKTRRG